MRRKGCIYLNQSLPFYPDNYINQILVNTAFPIIWFKLFGNIDMYNIKILQSLKDIVLKINSTPVFIWAHLLIPHSPFYRDENGKVNEKIISNPSISPPEEVSQEYKKYVFYGNNIVLDILKKIPEWKNKTIVISGDHGARMLLNTGDQRRFATFAAIYYRGMDTAELKQIRYLQQIPFHIH